MIRSKIVSVGSFLPQNKISNFDLEKKVETTNEWIVERTGIKFRHHVQEGELTSDLATKASENALSSSGITKDDIDLIIVATTTPDLTFPSTATIVQDKIGAKNAFAFDLQAVCSGFVYALSTADSFIKSGKAKNALVIGAETLSKILDWEDRTTCILFGDGAGAAILSATNEKDNSQIIGSKLYSAGHLSDILKTSGGVGLSKTAGYIEMVGKEVFRHAVEKMASSILFVVENCGFKINDIDWIVPHQANSRILKAVGKKLNFPTDKIIMTVDQHANTSAASIPLALDFAIKKNKIKKGDLVVLEALGGGLTWGAILLRY
jgi:3-oxoacyl-[acyl-carrier-protein] synthase-3